MSVGRTLVDLAAQKNSTEFKSEFDAVMADLATQKIAEMRDNVRDNAFAVNEEKDKRDVVDWSDVKDAAMETAKEIHGKVDKEKLDGILDNAKKHKPDSTAAAIELVQNMLQK